MGNIIHHGCEIYVLPNMRQSIYPNEKQTDPLSDGRQLRETKY